MGAVYSFVFFFLLLSWTAQQAQCFHETEEEKCIEETKRAEGITGIQPPGLPEKTELNCKEVICMGRLSTKPYDWGDDQFKHAHDLHCIGEFNVKADKVKCGM